MTEQRQPATADRYAGHSKHDDWWCECGHPYALREPASPPLTVDAIAKLLNKLEAKGWIRLLDLPSNMAAAILAELEGEDA